MRRHGMRFVKLRVEPLEERRQPSHSLPDAVLPAETNHGDDIAIAASLRQDDSPSAGSGRNIESEHGHSYQEYDDGRDDSSSGNSHGRHGDDFHGGDDGNESHAPQAQQLISDDGDAESFDDHGHGAANHGEDHGNAFGHADNGNHGLESGVQAQASPPSTPAASETRTVVDIIIPITPAASAAPGRQVHYQPKAVTRDDGEGDDPGARMEITPSVDSFSAAKTVAANGNARHERDIVANEAVAATAVERVAPAAEAPVAS